MDDWKAIAALVVSFGGLLLGAFYRLGGRINALGESTRNDMASYQSQTKAEDDRLHERVNRVRDEYVRRDDLDKDIKALERNIDALREDVRSHTAGTNERLDKLISTLKEH